MNTLTTCMTEDGNAHRIAAMNPKAITDQQMYGIKDPVSEEWTPGVFASIWQKLNTVLDDNKILTLANNDRIPMTDNCRIVFEVENLNNASPATVSRAGIIYVSQTDLGPEPVWKQWLAKRVEH